MSFFPPEGGGGSSGPLPPASIPDLYNPNKTLSNMQPTVYVNYIMRIK